MGQMKERLKLHAFVVAATTMILFVVGAGMFLRGDQSDGGAMMAVAIAWAAVGAVWLWLKWAFYCFLQRRLERAAVTVKRG